MSANAELVRQAFEALSRGDYGEAAPRFHDDAVWHNTADFPGERSCVGPAAIVDFWRALMEHFEGAEERMQIEQTVEGEHAVVLAIHSVGRGRASTVPIDVRWGAAFHVRNGRISRVDVHGDWRKALSSAGLAD